MEMGDVWVVTTQRLLVFHGSNLDYILNADQVADVSIWDTKISFATGRRFGVRVDWRGGPPLHQKIKDFYHPGGFQVLFRYVHAEANLVAGAVRNLVQE
jgi:hypothetical protein